MKIKFKPSFLFFFVYIVFFSHIKAQADYYWSNKQKIPIEKDNPKVLVKTFEKSGIEQRLLRVSSIETLERINSRSILISLKTNLKFASNKIKSISSNSILSFKSTDGYELILTGEILLKPKQETPIEQINKLTDGRINALNERCDCYTVTINNYKEILNLSNKIYESGLVDYYHPNFIEKVEQFAENKKQSLS